MFTSFSKKILRPQPPEIVVTLDLHGALLQITLFWRLYFFAKCAGVGWLLLGCTYACIHTYLSAFLGPQQPDVCWYFPLVSETFRF